MREQLPYAKKLVLPTSEKLKEFLSSFLDVESSNHFRATVTPVIGDTVTGKARCYEVDLHPVSLVSSVQAMSLELLDASLLDGALREWKYYLGKLDGFTPVAA